MGDAGQPGQVGEHDDRRRRPVRLRRRDARVPLPHVLRRVAGRELLRAATSPTGSGSPIRSSARGGQFYVPIITDPVVSAARCSPARTNGLPDEDARPRDDDARRGPAALQRVDGRLRRPCGDWAELGHTVGDRRCSGRPCGWRSRRGRADERGHVDGVGGDDHRPRVHLEERRRRSGRGGDVDAARRRLARSTRTGSSASIYVDPANGEPRVGLVQRASTPRRRRRRVTCSR